MNVIKFLIKLTQIIQTKTHQLDRSRSSRQEILLRSLQLIESLQEDIDVVVVRSKLDHIEDIVRARIMLQNTVQLLDDGIKVLLFTFEIFGHIVEWKDVLLDLEGIKS